MTRYAAYCILVALYAYDVVTSYPEWHNSIAQTSISEDAMAAVKASAG